MQAGSMFLLSIWAINLMIKRLGLNLLCRLLPDILLNNIFYGLWFWLVALRIWLDILWCHYILWCRIIFCTSFPESDPNLRTIIYFITICNNFRNISRHMLNLFIKSIGDFATLFTESQNEKFMSNSLCFPLIQPEENLVNVQNSLNEIAKSHPALCFLL